MTDESQEASGDHKTKRQTVRVSAKHCLWFADEQSPFTGPWGEDGSDPENSPYVPREILLGNARKVFFRDTHSIPQEWKHGPDDDLLSDANGRERVTVELEDERYRDFNLGHIQFEDPPFQVGKLVAIFNYYDDVGNTHWTDIKAVDVGMGEDSSPLPLLCPDPANNLRLYLGFHDGKRWTNNDGEIEFELEILMRKGAS